MSRSAFALILVVLLGSPSHGTEWAKKLFKDYSKDFGTVARSAKVDHTFEMVNPFQETIHIASVRASCGCSTPTIVKRTLKTWEKGGIHVRYNTHTFTGKKGATITVVIDKPFYAEVQLNVKGYIRGDVMFQPGVVTFDAIDEGRVETRTVSVNYSGRRNWEIVDVLSGNTNFEVELNERRRSAGRVDYDLLVRAKESMPSGYFNDQLVLVTNDRNSPQVPIRVEGKVVPGLTVSPASFSLGVIKPGDAVSKKLVVRGKQPFRITNVTCADDGFDFEATDTAKAMHLVPLTFTAGEAGTVTQNITIETDSAGSATCLVTVTVRD